MFAAAFFGGGFAVILVAAVNARRLGRLQQDTGWLVLGAAITATIGWLALSLGDVEGGRRQLRIASLAAGFLMWGLFHKVHGKMQRAMQTFGTKPPTPYLVFVGAVAFGWMMSAVVVACYLGFNETTP